MSRDTSLFRHPHLAVLYVLGFLLLAEWLFPLPQFTDTGYVLVFLMLAGFFFILSAIPMSTWLRLPLVVLAILVSLDVIFFTETFMSVAWWQTFMSEAVSQGNLLLTGEWQTLSPMFRTLLFMIMLMLMSFLIYYWVIYVKRILFFFACSVIYVAILDTFTMYEGSWAMIRLVVIGFVLLAYLKLSRLSTVYANISWRDWTRWSIGTTLVIFVAGSVAFFGPKFSPQWPNPVPYIQAAGGFGEGYSTENRRIGYGEHDDRLGGGFELDESPVMYAEVEDPGYWRGEAKHIYTGHGWESEQHGEAVEEQGELNLYEEQTDVEENEATLRYTPYFQTRELIFAQGEFFEATSAEQPLNYYVDAISGRIEMGSGYDEEVGMNLSYREAEFSIERMQEVPFQEGDAGDPEGIELRYLQTPEELPERVTELAAEITSEETDRYRAVRAVEDHLRNEYEYETEDVPIPEEGQDYVDQFLFESQYGYCDNFSTAMVVMLRSQDIPARWVKGFTPGEEVEDGTYQITNANAHSWVEVYFPEVGWVPFEPTPGFNNEANHAYTDLDLSDSPDLDDRDVPDPLEDEQLDEGDTNEEEESAAVGSSNADGGLSPVLIGLISVMLLGGIIVFFLRERIIINWMKRKHQDIQSTEQFQRAYLSLLWLLRFTGFKRNKYETLSEYANRIDQRLDNENFTRLTRQYEDLYYGKERSSITDGTNEQYHQLLRDVHSRIAR
ncbi:DUF4129 domain-containing transglutaminase family protein [Geomicrobium sediminis]|uniref:Transglutaminase-like putative cysteine protease n=1 Tax=Geomicrobium sediminis TaxID=1347788 RepID=A0ABS2PAK6_9BACL|nr:transglutaminase domain-containing protein [Geomicrobium sediminis]MBM7632110.1 transglutaminase-like putative cysteine protease [Geomicrobium sediminis]